MSPRYLPEKNHINHQIIARYFQLPKNMAVDSLELNIENLN